MEIQEIVWIKEKEVKPLLSQRVSVLSVNQESSSVQCKEKEKRKKKQDQDWGH